MAFLDLHPIRPGHTQIIPKDHYPYFEDIPAITAQRIFETAQAFSRAMKGLYHVPRVALVFTGGDVPHAHAHLVPMHEKTDITSRRYIVEKELTFQCTAKAVPEELEPESKRLKDSLRLYADFPKDNSN